MVSRRFDQEGFPISAFRLLSRLGAVSGVIALIALAVLTAPASGRLPARTSRSGQFEAGRCPRPTGAPATRRPAASTTCSARAGGSTSRGTSPSSRITRAGSSAGRTLRPCARAPASSARFAPRINGRVFALAKAQGLLFIGGSFSSVNGHARHNLAAFNLRTGRLSHRMRDLHIRGAVERARGDPSGGLRRRLVLVGRRPAAGEAGQAHRPRRPLPGGARVEAAGERRWCARSWSSRLGGSSPAATSRP